MWRRSIACSTPGPSSAEAPLWCEREQVLWWADIEGRALHRFDPATGTDTSIQLPRRIGCFALRESGGFVVALEDGFHFLDAEGGLTPITDPEPDRPGNRFNDGTTDHAGRFVAGTMPMGPRQPVGALYRLWPDRRCELLFDELTVTNGCAFSPDGRIFYFSDSEASVRTIWACDHDVASGALTNRRVFVDTHGLAGRPDGGTVDAEGCYWMAGVGGWQLVRFTPRGKVDRIVEVPGREADQDRLRRPRPGRALRHLDRHEPDAGHRGTAAAGGRDLRHAGSRRGRRGAAEVRRLTAARSLIPACWRSSRAAPGRRS